MCLGEAHCITEFEGKGTLFTSYKRVLSIKQRKETNSPNNTFGRRRTRYVIVFCWLMLLYVFVVCFIVCL